MNRRLDSAAKFAEIIGAVSVVVGLLFVGLEVRENTQAQRFDTTQSLVSEYNDAIGPMNDPEFICVYIRASNNFDELSQSDKIRFSVLMQPIFRTYEQLLYAEINNTIDTNVHDGFRRQYSAIMQLPGYQQYWEQRKHWFGDVFQAYTEEVIANAGMIPAANFGNEECE